MYRSFCFFNHHYYHFCNHEYLLLENSRFQISFFIWDPRSPHCKFWGNGITKFLLQANDDYKKQYVISIVYLSKTSMVPHNNYIAWIPVQFSLIEYGLVYYRDLIRQQLDS